MNGRARPIFERVFRRMKLFPRFLLLLLVFTAIVAGMLAVNFYSSSQAYQEFGRLVAEARSKLGAAADPASVLDQTASRLDIILQTTRNQMIAITAVALGLFAGAVLTAFATARSIANPLMEIRKALDAAAREIFHFDDLIFPAAPLKGPGGEKRRRLNPSLLGEIALEEDQDEPAQLAFSVNQLFDKIDTAFVDAGRKVSDRIEQVNLRSQNFVLVSEIGREIASMEEASTLEAVLQKITDLAAERFGYYHVGIYMADQDERVLILRSAAGEAGHQLKERGFSVRIGETSLVGYAVISGSARVVNNVETDYLYQKEPLLAQTRAEAVFPLVTGGRVVGVLDIQQNMADCFDAEHEALLQILASQAAMLIENKRLHTALEQAAEETRILYQRYIEQSWAQNNQRAGRTGFQYDRLEIQPTQRNLPPAMMAELARGEPLVVQVDQANADLFGLAPGSTALLAPILMYNRLVGVIGLESDAAYDQQPGGLAGQLPGHLERPVSQMGRGTGRRWSQDEIEVIKALSAQIALAMDNARLLEESQQRAGQLRLLQEVTAASSAQTDLLILLRQVTQTLAQGLRLPYTGALLLDPERQFADVASGWSEDPASMFNSLRNFRWPVANFGALAQLMHTGQSVVVMNVVDNDQAKPIQWILRQSGTRHLLLVPVIQQGRVIGVLDLHFVDDRQELSSEAARREYLRLFDQISLQITSAVEVARSFEEAQARADRERMLGEAARKMRETLDVQTILRTAADEIRAAFNLPEVTVRLMQTYPGSADGPAGGLE